MEEDHRLTVTPLGAGNEVGRSCIYLSYKSKSVLFDCGTDPASSGMAALPYFDEIDPSTVDVLLITDFHSDNTAALPYFMEKTTFRGRVFMTHATKAIYRLHVSDLIKVKRNMLYDEQDINRSMDKIEVIDFHQTIEVKGIRFCCYKAGHVLGAAMFMVDIAGVRVLYTGHYSREENRHLLAAEMPPFTPDICIIESTCGIQDHEPRNTREKRFIDIIRSTISEGGRVLIPAHALDRAQELLLILHEYWENHPDIQNIPIFYASPLARRCLSVYQTYTLSMNDTIQDAMSNPFCFKYISLESSIDILKDVGPSVVMASPGGLQGGLSRKLFEMWCSDKRNTFILPGYAVEGTLAKTILNKPDKVILSGLTVPLNMEMHCIPFSAHADFAQTSAFLEELNPPNIILVHGEATQMKRLKLKLMDQFANRNTNILTPHNCQSVEMYFNPPKMAKVIGKLAAKTPEVGGTVSGLLVKKDFTYQIMAPDDLIHLFKQLRTVNILQRITIPYSGPFSFLQNHLKVSFESAEPSLDAESGVPTLQVNEQVTIKHESDKHISLHWTSDPHIDRISDSIVEIVTKIEEENVNMQAFLTSMFGDVKVIENGKWEITIDGNVAKLDKENGEVESENEELKERVRTAFQRFQRSTKSNPRS